VKSEWYLIVQANTTDASSYMVQIANNSAHFMSTPTAAGGVWTYLGSAQTIPANQIGIPYTFRIKGNTLSLLRNGIQVAQHVGVTPLAGRCVGFGGYKRAYTNLNDNPLAQFAGISWQPVT
jgi:hypothetical protein